MPVIAPSGEIRDIPFADALGERYLSYALSTIMSRSLPDVRDGLKPVHRRILHAMQQLRLDPASGYKKCARVVGDVIGKFHPHGELAVYDALVRLAQDFSQRYPLIDGQGNFGNIDGDNAAAMRYTESRLSPVAQAMLEGIDEDAVDFRPTYDGEDREPVILPARFPNLLANGASGIAVGMATSIPPHNAGEICAGLLHLIDNPGCSVAELHVHLAGPDFPTGGVLVEPDDSILQAYETGRGSFRLRARWLKEALGHGLYQIVITEMPYQVQKSRLIEKVAALLEEKKLPLLADIRDESAEDVRLVLEPKTRNVDADLLMEQLFRLTELEVRVPLNLNVLDPQGVPRVMNLKEVLRAFLDHRRVVLQRRSRHRLAAVARRIEILRGQIIVYVNLDEVIRIIREADDPKAEMMARWDLSDTQVEAILNMRLRALRRLEEIEIRKELEALGKEQAGLEALLGNERRQWRAIADEVAKTRAEFGGDTALGRRRTAFAAAPAIVEIPAAALVEREAVTVLCSQKGWIRAVRGHNIAAGEQRYKEGDAPRFAVAAETTDRLMVFASNGRFYTLGVDRLPGGRGQGEPLRLMIDLPNEHDVVAMFPYRPGKLLIAANDGRGFVVDADEAVAQTRAGKQILTPAAGAAARICLALTGDHVALVGDNRRMLILRIDEIPEMSRGRGVILQRYREGGLADGKAFRLEDGFSWRQGENRTRTETALGPWLGARGSAGRAVPQGFPRSGRFG
ncbi:MAG: DNA topoisomerase IV subunit A [Alphaproteobacteria bacterium]|nr:DNA topoisomerase IV subunit A [Alphaproteobacteria bacterium]MBV9863457.1 DNA topoisomerase IV subunit A [Alphaproteobacteria bacterium]